MEQVHVVLHKNTDYELCLHNHSWTRFRHNILWDYQGYYCLNTLGINNFMLTDRAPLTQEGLMHMAGTYSCPDSQQ